MISTISSYILTNILTKIINHRPYNVHISRLKTIALLRPWGDLAARRRVYLDRLTATHRERDERWARRLHKSPFGVDLVAEYERISEENRVRDLAEQRRLSGLF